MSQSGLEWFSSAAGIGIVIFDVLMLFALWNIFYQSQKEKTTIAGVAILMAINIALELWQGLPRYGHFFVSAMLILAYSFVKHKKHCEKAVLALTLFYGFHSMSFLVADSASEYLFSVTQERLDITSSSYIENLYACTLYAQIALFVLYMGLFVLMLAVLSKALGSVQKMSWYDVCFLSVLNIVGGLLAKMIVDISLVKLENEVFDLFAVKKEVFWKLPLIAVLLFLGELSVIIIYQKYQQLQRERQQHFAEQQQVKAMKRRLEEAENFYGSIRKARHEMKSHMANIKGLVAGEQYAEVGRYIEKLDETIGELDYRYVTGNAVTDVIINDKGKKAEKAAIDFDVRFFYEDTGGIDVFDMGILLSNLLDNAITACEKIAREERHIRLSLKRKKKFLLLEVENSFDRVIRHGDDGIPLTTKDVSLPEILMEHGIGLRNVKEIAERYLGTMDITVKGKAFKVTVMLQQKEERNDEI